MPAQFIARRGVSKDEAQKKPPPEVSAITVLIHHASLCNFWHVLYIGVEMLAMMNSGRCRPLSTAAESPDARELPA